MTLFRSSGCSRWHAAPREGGMFQAKLVVDDPQGRPRSNPEVATKHLARTERPFFKHRANCSHKAVCQGPSEPRTVKRSFLPW
jgi:hypothetical protein